MKKATIPSYLVLLLVATFTSSAYSSQIMIGSNSNLTNNTGGPVNDIHFTITFFEGSSFSGPTKTNNDRGWGSSWGWAGNSLGITYSTDDINKALNKGKIGTFGFEFQGDLSHIRSFSAYWTTKGVAQGYVDDDELKELKKVSEPSILALLGAGLAGLGFARRHRTR